MSQSFATWREEKLHHKSRSLVEQAKATPSYIVTLHEAHHLRPPFLASQDALEVMRVTALCGYPPK